MSIHTPVVLDITYHSHQFTASAAADAADAAAATAADVVAIALIAHQYPMVIY